MRKIILPLCVCLAWVAPLRAEPSSPSKPSKSSLYDIAKLLTSKTFVDLTHTFKPGIPHWKGYPDQRVKILYTHPEDGFKAEQYQIAGQWGTHADAPSHFHSDLRTLDEIPVNDMVAPLVVVDISTKVSLNPDAVCSVDDLRDWEKRHGKMPERAFVALRTDWSKRWPDQDLMQNKDNRGVMHYPGWSVEALRFLILERNAVAVGHETSDTDAGFNVSVERYPCQAYVHGENRYQIEFLSNLEQVPESGALAIIAFPKPDKGSGFPARVFAILP